MAYLTEGQKSGLEYLLKDYPIQKAGLIDYDKIRPLRTYEIPPSIKDQFYTYSDPDEEKDYVIEPGLEGLTEHPDIGTMVQPKGPPLAPYRERGANPFPYVLDLEKFGMATGPKPDEQGRLNQRIATAVAHERRHQVLADNPEILEMLKVSALTGGTDVEEAFNRYLDSLAQGKNPSIHDIQGLFRNVYMDRPGQKPLGLEGLNKIFHKARQKYLKTIEPRAGPQAPAARPKETYVSPARPHGDGRNFQPQRPDKPGGFTDPGKGSYGPWKAKGGIIDKPLPGRSRYL